ncbi:MAG: TIGR01777 family oxidoreductase [Gemmatimonadota bacterium]|nr:TIGR01777 family oxidoreductase [Gemmatimonadota bacterium]
MKVLVTGGTGFLGRRVVAALTEHGHRAVVVSRGTDNPWNTDAVELVRSDPTRPGPWQTMLGTCDAVINLAGAPIVDPPHRWTETRKLQIRESRLETTRCIVDAFRHVETPPAVFVSASAVGYYGSRGDRKLDETAPAGDDFLARLCIEWEEAARGAADITRVTLLRTGIALGAGGGALHSMLTPFRLGVGGPWGAGSQWWSWIHVADVVGLILLALERDLPGAVNAVAPNPVTVNEFAKTLGSVLSRPAVARVPEFALRLALGEAAEAMLASQRVVPRRALDVGYAFQYPELRPALEAALHA